MKQVLGEKYPNTLTSLGNLALIYHHEQQHKEAETLEVQVIEAYATKLSPNHPEILTIITSVRAWRKTWCAENDQ